MFRACAAFVRIDRDTMLDLISNVFYDPEIFWGVPLALALLWPLWRRFSLRQGSKGRDR